MSSESLLQKINQHLMESTRVGRLQADMMTLKQKRMDEVITLKAVDGGLKDSELVAALRQKGTTIEKLAAGRDSIHFDELAKLNIYVA